jgi:hypothetical protein
VRRGLTAKAHSAWRPIRTAFRRSRWNCRSFNTFSWREYLWGYVRGKGGTHVVALPLSPLLKVVFLCLQPDDRVPQLAGLCLQLLQLTA